MLFKKHRWIILTLTVICVAAQMLALAPHHHHSDSETPCFNIVHCIEHDGAHKENDSQECYHNHCTPEQEPMSGHDCSVKIDIAEVANTRDYRTSLSAVIALNDLCVAEFATISEQNNTLHLFTLTRRRQEATVPNICVEYLAEAHSARAPSRLA